MPRIAQPLTTATELRLRTLAEDVDNVRAQLGRLEAKRDSAIRKARVRGGSLRAIAEAAGVSHQHVANLAAEADL